MNDKSVRLICRLSSAALVSVALSACTDALVFSESAGFNLSIGVNEEPSTPLQLNAGLERTVLAFAPPVGENTTVAGKKQVNGEAVSLFSGFRLSDDHASEVTNALAGRLTIRTQFASGMAAQAVAGKVQVVKAITNVGVSYLPDDGTRLLRVFMNESGENFAALKQWMVDNGVRERFPEPFLVGKKYKAARAKAVKDLRLQ